MRDALPVSNNNLRSRIGCDALYMPESYALEVQGCVWRLKEVYGGVGGCR